MHCRGPDNQIGFALLLAKVRLTGRFPYDLTVIPRSVVHHICDQLQLDPPFLLAYSNVGRRDITISNRYAPIWDLGSLQQITPLQSLKQATGPPSPKALEQEAVDSQTGQELWRFETEGAVFGSPVFADGVVYFLSGDGTFYAVAIR